MIERLETLEARFDTLQTQVLRMADLIEKVTLAQGTLSDQATRLADVTKEILNLLDDEAGT